jgi:hypothetical protein
MEDTSWRRERERGGREGGREGERERGERGRWSKGGELPEW